MPIVEHVDLQSKKILVSVINYGNEDEVIEFAGHLAKQTASDRILLSVTANKWSEKGRLYLEQGLKQIPLDMLLFDPGDNLGYLNGTLFGYNAIRKCEDFKPKWVAISNTDITFSSETFYADLLDKEYPAEVGCIAPSVYVPATGAFENPRYLRRFTKSSLENRVKIFTRPFLFGIQQKLGAWKAGKARGEEKESQYAYLAHGCCFFVVPELADALCEKPFGTLLYSEEAYVAEMGISIGKRVFYDNSLKLVHHENAVTGKLRNAQRAKMFADSLSLIIDQFYSNGISDTQYTCEDVCAVIVSYNDASRMEQNVAALTEAGVAVVIIDNGSNDSTIAQLHDLEKQYGCILFENQENLGIASALQQGLRYAYAQHYGLMLTLDQDSIVCQGMVEELIRILNNNSQIASVGPKYSSFYKPAQPKDTVPVDYLITSGNLVRVNQAVCVGGFDEQMFIDSVDFDFSLKLKSNGFSSAIAQGAHLQHSIGETYSPKGVLSRFRFGIHSPLRYYYMVRNHIVLCNRYQKQYPIFCLKKNVSMMMELAKIVFIFPEKKRYFAALRKGRTDARQGILGRCRDCF